MGGRASLQLPVGATSDRSATLNNGLIRFNTTTSEVEVYMSGTWRALRFKENTYITQQTIGTGNGASTIFGALNPTPPSVTESSNGTNITFGPQNYFVFIENVPQIATTNYTLVQNPTSTVTSYATGTQNIGTSRLYLTPTNGALTNFTDVIANVQVGATVTATVSGGAAFAANTTISAIGSNYIDLSAATIRAIPANSSITVTYISGYYLQFTSAATLNKPITVLHGFDK
jgi:hypothetical protein